MFLSVTTKNVNCKILTKVHCKIQFIGREGHKKPIYSRGFAKHFLPPVNGVKKLNLN